jgi:hypothetical protein
MHFDALEREFLCPYVCVELTMSDKMIIIFKCATLQCLFLTHNGCVDENFTLTMSHFLKRWAHKNVREIAEYIFAQWWAFILIPTSCLTLNTLQKSWWLRRIFFQHFMVGTKRERMKKCIYLWRRVFINQMVSSTVVDGPVTDTSSF